MKGKACFESITCLAVGIHVCRQDFPVGLAHSCCVPSHSPSTQGNGIVSELTFAVRHAEHERGRRQLPHWNVKELLPLPLCFSGVHTRPGRGPPVCPAVASVSRVNFAFCSSPVRWEEGQNAWDIVSCPCKFRALVIYTTCVSHRLKFMAVLPAIQGLSANTAPKQRLVLCLVVLFSSGLVWFRC